MNSFKYVIQQGGKQVVVADCNSQEACAAAARLMNMDYCVFCRQFALYDELMLVCEKCATNKLTGDN